jgi:hypothetical protein
MINPFLGHENLSLTKYKKQRGVPLGSSTLKFWVCRTSSWPRKLREPKFQPSRSYVLGCRWGTNFCQRWRRHVTDGNFRMLFSRFMAFYQWKTWFGPKKNFNFFGKKRVKPIILSIYSIYDESKRLELKKNLLKSRKKQRYESKKRNFF